MNRTPEAPPPGEPETGGGPAGTPKSLPILPLRGTVVFPDEIIPLVVGREGSLKVIEATQSGDKVIGIITQKDPTQEDPGPDDLYTVGTTALVVKSIRMPDGSYRSVVHGLSRFRVLGYVSTSPYLQASIEAIPVDETPSETIAALAANLRVLFQKLVELAPYLSEESSSHIISIEQPERLTDAIAAVINATSAERQGLLERIDLKARLELLTVLLTKELQNLEVASKIQSQVAGEIGRSQREYFLREQMKAIQKELGESDDRDAEVHDLREKIESLNLPEEAKKEAERELKRMSRMAPESAEHTVARTYLDWILELPWNTRSTDSLDLKHAREILDADHHGLQKIKKRILEFLAVRQLKPDTHGPIQCLVGPPGVGKTSLGRSIARALGRKFIRVSLGGMHDEAEIRGHRRTYIGALPGKVIQELKKAGSRNPVFMFDEIDKLGRDFRGDPASALLEVLDPEQNRSFVDHYLNVPFDLSEVLFIATANVLDTIPPPLLDRMETMELPGYTEEEKMVIARTHLVPKQLREHGLSAEQLEFSDDALRDIVGSYTREAGVRNLEREIAKICRGTASAIVEGTLATESVDAEKLPKYLGQPKFFSDVAQRTLITGVATGLAYTPYGGDILFIEATRMKGRGHLLLTGKLGEVMKESAHTALSYLKSKADEIGIDKELFRSSDIHVHIPAGAVPKDGPSAGVTLYTALLSLFSGRRVRSEVAMTGEITLRGLVLPVGGIKEKILAARRAGVREVILPERNRKDVAEITEQEIHQLTFHYVTWMDEIPPLALLPAAPDGISPARDRLIKGADLS